MSVTIIDSTKDKAPIYVYEPPPMFKTKLDEQRYWEQEKQRWVEGYQDMPGTFYYMVTQGWVKDRITGIVSRPEVREVDLYIHEFIAAQRNKKRMGGIIKPRGVGFSTQIGILCNYFMRVYPGSTSIVTSKDQDGIQTIFKEKVMPAYDNMPVSIKPDIINKNDTKQMCYMRVQIPVQKESSIDYSESEIYLRETSETPKSPTNLSGKGAIFGAYDEFPLHPRRKELLNSSIECYRNPKTKELDGFLLWGGTVEAALTSEQLVKFRSMVSDSTIWDCDILFIPFWMQMFLTNGWADQKKAEEWWEKEYDKLSKTSDKEAITAFIRNNPRSLDDIFDSTEGSRWEDDVSELIKHQRKLVVNTRPDRKKGKMIDYSNRAEFVPDGGGNVIIMEDPKPNILYYLLVDGVATGTETGASESEGSKVAGLIVKGFDPDGGSYKPVGMYLERPKTVEQSYINLVSLVKYYNRYESFKGIMAEANASTADHFATFLNRMGLGRFIMYRKSLSGSKNGNQNKPFYYVNNEVRDYQMRQANPFLRKYISSIELIELLDQMLMAKEENTDVLDAWLMLFLALPPDYDASPKEKKVQRRRMVRVYSRNANGQLVTQWKTV
jgi:hypothetical protein